MGVHRRRRHRGADRLEPRRRRGRAARADRSRHRVAGLSPLRALGLAHGVYWLVGGVWPLAHFPSFELVFGRKREDWLAQCVAAFLASLGLALLAARGRPSRDLRLGAALGGAGIASIAAREAARGRISPLYLADAVVEWAFALAWLATLAGERDVTNVARAVRPASDGA